MSFSHDAKIEVLESGLENDCCPLAFLNGVFHACGEIGFSDKKIVAYITTDNIELYDYCNKILQTLYGDMCELEVSDGYAINKKVYYNISFPKDKSEEILFDSGIIKRGDTGSIELRQDLPSHIKNSECCLKAFLKGVFVGCATSNIRISEIASQKTSNGYHLEFTAHNYEFLQQLQSILEEFDLSLKIATRKNTYVLYLKEANQVCDVLALVGANISVLKLQNEIIARDMRNKINRETNCFSANISKTVNASMRQLEAINNINEKRGLETLPSDLYEVAILRLANQEESLEELLKLSTINLTKSGLNHRFRKIIKISEDINKNN